MTTLTIKDLLLNEELDRKTMAGVRGGWASYWLWVNRDAIYRDSIENPVLPPEYVPGYTA